MAQEIKIPVSVNGGDAEKVADDIAGAFGGVADAVNAIDAASRKAADGIGRVADRAKELQTVQRWLSEQLGTPVSANDAGMFMGRLDVLRKRRDGLGRGLRAFDTTEDFLQGYRSFYGRNANRYRGFVLGTGMQGTEYARRNGIPGPGAGGGGGGEEDGGFAAGVNRARTTALGFGKSMLALAGISSVMGMAGHAADLGTEESVGIDTLKRRLGDLGVDFNNLRAQARSAGQGLGVTYVESQRLANQYARTVGNLKASDLGDLGGVLRNGMSLSRAYGLDLEQGDQFFGTLAKNGVARSESDQRRFAMLIGDAVARSGYSGKVDELLEAVANYTQTAARATLTVPNSEAYTNAITSMLSKGYAGMGPNEAAALLGRADASVRHGGARGEASMNFLYNALRNFSPGLRPTDAIALWEGGLFGTTRSVFGSGPLAGRVPASSLNGTTTFEKIMRSLKPHYKDPGYLAEALKGIFGRDLTQAQVTALADMTTSGQVGQSISLLKASGMNPNAVDLVNLPTIGRLASAKDMAGLRGVYADLNQRSDLTPQQRAALDQAMKAGDTDQVRKALTQFVASLHGQEETDGSKTRKSIADLQNALTTAGGGMLAVLNPIRDAVVAIAGRLVPGYIDLSGTTPGNPEHISPAELNNGLKGHFDSKVESQAMQKFMSLGWSRMQAAAIVGNMLDESGGNPMASNRVKGGHRGLFQWDARRWNDFLIWAKKRGKDPNSPEAQEEYFDYELRHSEVMHGQRLGDSSSVNEANSAVIDALRPGGWQHVGSRDSVEGYDVRLALARRLATQPAPTQSGGAQQVQVAGEAHVVMHSPDGRKQTVKVPLKSAGQPPAAAGTAPPPSYAGAILPSG